MLYQLQDNQTLILASASPRRKEFLSQLGIAIEIQPANIDEQERPGELVQDLVQRLALEKAKSVANKFPDAWVLAADTLVALDGQIFSKPSTEAEAFATLQALAGKEHQVFGGVALVNLACKFQEVQLSETKVTFTKLKAAQINAYLKTQEPFDKAGSYGIQGFGAHFVEELKGSYTNVVGLDLALVVNLLLKHEVIKVQE